MPRNAPAAVKRAMFMGRQALPTITSPAGVSAIPRGLHRPGLVNMPT